MCYNLINLKIFSLCRNEIICLFMKYLKIAENYARNAAHSDQVASTDVFRASPKIPRAQLVLQNLAAGVVRSARRAHDRSAQVEQAGVARASHRAARLERRFFR